MIEVRKKPVYAAGLPLRTAPHPPPKKGKGGSHHAGVRVTERNKWSINDIEVIAVLISMSSLALSTNRSLDLVIFFSSASKSIR